MRKRGFSALLPLILLGLGLVVAVMMIGQKTVLKNHASDGGGPTPTGIGIPTATPVPPTSDVVTGYLDGVRGGSNCSVYGWARTVKPAVTGDNIGEYPSINVNFYASRLLPNGAVDFYTLGMVVANLTSEAGVGGSGHHRFDGVPTYIKTIQDGLQWNVMAFGVDPVTQKEYALSNSPKQITCSISLPAGYAPQGFLESASCDRYGKLTVKGWSGSTASVWRNLDVNIYAEYLGYGVGTAKVMTLLADQSRLDVCGNVKGIGCNTGFSGTANIFKGGYPLSNSTVNVSAYGVDPWIGSGSGGTEHLLQALPGKSMPLQVACGN